MESTGKRRLGLLVTGVLLTAVATPLAQILLAGGTTVDAEPYAVAVGLGVAMPLLLAGVYPLTSVDDRRTRAVLVVAESAAGVGFGVAAVAVLLAVDPPTAIPIGGAAAGAYLGGVAARALVLGRVAVDASITGE